MQYILGMYGTIDNPNGLEKWNMHTLEGVQVSPDKIKQVSAGDKTSALDIALTMYDMERGENESLGLEYLDEWVQYTKDLKNSKINPLANALQEYQKRQASNPHYKMERFETWITTMGLSLDIVGVDKLENKKE